MFHWICPECGREIPPSVRECQHCDPQQVEPVAAAPAPVEEPAPAPVQQPLPVALPTPEPAHAAVPEPPPEPIAAPPMLVLPASQPALDAAPSSAEPVPVKLPEPELPAAALAALPQPAAEPVEPQSVILPTAEIAPEPPPPPAVEAAPEPVAESVPEPVSEVAAPPAPEIKRQDVPDPLLALAEEIRAAQAARAAAPPVKSVEPHPIMEPSLPEPPALPRMGLAELAEAVEQHRLPAVPEPLPAAAQPWEVPASSAEATQADHKPELAAVALADQPKPEDTDAAQLQLELGTLRLPVAVQPDPQPVPQALAAPEPEPEGPVLPLAPMQKYTPATRNSIRPASPPVKILGADAGPRITLPGPSLPPELTRLQDANPVTDLVEHKEAPKATANAPVQAQQGSWFVTVMVALMLSAVAGSAFYFLVMPRIVADAKPAATPAEAATVPAPVKSTNPLARFVEVTGFRIVVDSSKKSEVQYLVVNHSDADIANANVFVTLHGAKAGSPTVCRFSFKIPSLAPFEAKQMSSPIERARTLALPDWQDLRADVQISQ
jgi:hypothetical protein